MPHLTLTTHSVYFESRGEGPPVVLLHHATASSSNWRKQIPALVQAGFRAIVYDRRGFGRSDPWPRWPLDYHQHGVKELVALMDALAIDRAHLVGHSDGATISLMTAAQHAHRVAAVVAEAPHMWIEPDWLDSGFETFRQTVGRSERFWAALRRDHGDRAEEVVERWRGRWLDPAFRSWDVSEYLPRIACPVLVIHGAQDVFFPISHSQTIAEAIPQSEFWLLEDAGHTPHLEKTELFTQRLIAFLRHVS
ncbi:MAG: alpha/beta hydrolase [Chloroflexi bacterium]|nr:alpha/beta hydrolase [Chloroflexota bacterium]